MKVKIKKNDEVLVTAGRSKGVRGRVMAVFPASSTAIVEFSMSEVPIMQVNLSGEYGLVRLKEIAEDLQDRIEQIPSVLRADLRGGLEREVQVDVHLDRLQFYGVAIQDVLDAIRFENVNIPGGSIDVGNLKYLVRVDGQFDEIVSR